MDAWLLNEILKTKMILLTIEQYVEGVAFQECQEAIKNLDNIIKNLKGE